MKQILQNYRTGELLLAEVLIPPITNSRILIRNQSSLVSASTERQMILFRFNSDTGVLIVWVKDSVSSIEEGKGVAHSLQNLESSGLLV